MNGATLAIGVVAGVALAGFLPRERGSADRPIGASSYARSPWSERKQLLVDYVSENGYQSGLGLLQAMFDAGGNDRDAVRILERDRDWLVNEYGEGAYWRSRCGAGPCG